MSMSPRMTQDELTEELRWQERNGLVTDHLYIAYSNETIQVGDEIYNLSELEESPKVITKYVDKYPEWLNKALEEIRAFQEKRYESQKVLVREKSHNKEC